mgnify:CR=1 FL=1
MRVYLRAQSDIKTQVRAVLRDTGSARWTDAEVYQAMNLALATWQGRVSVPMLYSLPGGLDAGVNEYAIPGYIRPPFKPQYLALGADGVQIDDTVYYEWQDIRDWDADPDAEDGWVLRIRSPISSTEARIIWYAHNGSVPTTIPAIPAAGDITATSTSVQANAALDVGDAGYVFCGSEWMGYAGLTRAASATTLGNLVRGVNDTTAAVHAAAATLTWGIAAPSGDLYLQLIDQTAMFLHQMFLGQASPNERDLHERMISYFKGNAEMFWRRYVPARSPRFRAPATRAG